MVCLLLLCGKYGDLNRIEWYILKLTVTSPTAVVIYEDRAEQRYATDDVLVCRY